MLFRSLRCTSGVGSWAHALRCLARLRRTIDRATSQPSASNAIATSLSSRNGAALLFVSTVTRCFSPNVDKLLQAQMSPVCAVLISVDLVPRAADPLAGLRHLWQLILAHGSALSIPAG